MSSALEEIRTDSNKEPLSVAGSSYDDLYSYFDYLLYRGGDDVPNLVSDMFSMGVRHPPDAADPTPPDEHRDNPNSLAEGEAEAQRREAVRAVLETVRQSLQGAGADGVPLQPHPPAGGSEPRPLAAAVPPSPTAPFPPLQFLATAGKPAPPQGRYARAITADGRDDAGDNSTSTLATAVLPKAPGCPPLSESARPPLAKHPHGGELGLLQLPGRRANKYNELIPQPPEELRAGSYGRGASEGAAPLETEDTVELLEQALEVLLPNGVHKGKAAHALPRAAVSPRHRGEQEPTEEVKGDESPHSTSPIMPLTKKKALCDLEHPLHQRKETYTNQLRTIHSSTSNNNNNISSEGYEEEPLEEAVRREMGRPAAPLRLPRYVGMPHAPNTAKAPNSVTEPGTAVETELEPITGDAFHTCPTHNTARILGDLPDVEVPGRGLHAHFTVSTDFR
ncbi:hypothetical protein STCU_10778 [Strigomonas culicis]|uniref:Uncharacterized protein n=1 Tax=Strigomonas culicis TaxID=28005 RepID=S9TK44_9TRYP|nr:hypothetical protein STCU_10778 [Strigomonas culicis]|eukprot:EPY17194.1 hypothetical protein STCU_10778 [Strigomonas culicis]